ncbi:MAG TPA: TIM-barrel domain-containing protein, partial [Dehalococcoidia bacterium]|nr:TIM-barrel domain-containing protein [Dehalococcoidia bacterium]
GGETVRVSIVFARPEVVRVRAWLGEQAPPAESPMLVEGALAGLKPGLRGVGADEEGVTLDSRALRVRVGRKPWSVRVETGGRALLEQRPDDRQLLGPLVLPTGYSKGADGRISFHESWSLEPDERLYGLGEQFGPFDKRGQRIVFWCRDPLGAVTTTISYLNVPFLLSSRGYGLFVHHNSKIVYELGNPSPQSAAFRVEDPWLDYFVVYGPSLKEIIGRYVELTGRPVVPPLWSFGVWYSRCMYRDRAQVEGIVERLRELGIPGDVVHLDPLWLKERRKRTRDGCDFEWDEEAFPVPEGFVRWLRERGFKLSLWENPYVWEGTEMHREGVEKGYFAKANEGGLARPLDNPDETALVDFTNPEAARWWQEKHRRYLRMGVAAFKTDYGEATPPDAVFADGRTGKQLHNLYPLLYNRSVFGVSAEERGEEAMVFARSGYAGSQRYPINWTGDAPCTWGGMAATLRAGLSLSLSGIPMWSHDIGGFWNPDGMQPPDATLYIRWAQFGLLSSHARFHGIRGREPWYYGDQAVEIVREFARLRYRLLPYIYSLAREAAESGLPVVRPLVLEYPQDPAAEAVDFEYLLGRDLLVAPVTNAEGRCVVYLPEGQWCDWWTGEVLRGPRHTRLTAPIERMPMYARLDSVLPLAPALDYVGQRPWEPLSLEVRLGSRAETRAWTPAGDVTVTASRDGDDVRVSVDGPSQEYEVRFVEPERVRDVAMEGDARVDAVEQVAGVTVVRATGKGRWELRAGLAREAPQ